MLALFIGVVFATDKMNQEPWKAVHFNKNCLHHLYDKLGQSNIMYLLEKHVRVKIYAPPVKDLGEASEIYQTLGKEAQDNVGIEAKYQVPIRKRDHLHNEGARCQADRIYVNEEFINNAPYVIKKYIMYHESIHKKYNDNTVPIVANIGALGITFVSYIIMFQLPVRLLFKLILPNVLGVTSLVLFASRSHYYEERRADVEGLYAMSCYKCVNDVSNYLIRGDNNDGYLNNTEIGQIAKVLKRQNKLCKNHSHQ